MKATRESIRALPAPKWTIDEIHHVGTTRNHHGEITVVFKRGSLVQHVLVASTLLEDAVKAANRLR